MLAKFKEFIVNNPKVVHITLLVMLMLGGLLASVSAKNRLANLAVEVWKAESQIYIENITSNFLNWLDRESQVLRGAAVQFYTDEDFQPEEFRSLVDLFEFSSDVAYSINMAYVYENSQGDYQVGMSSGSREIWLRDDFFTLKQVQDTLTQAFTYPNDTVMGSMFNYQGRYSIILATVVPSGEGGGVLLLELELPLMLEGFRDLYMPKGSFLTIQIPSSEEDIVIDNEYRTEDLIQHQFNLRSSILETSVTFDWKMDGQFKGGPDFNLSIFSFYGGLIVSALIVGVFWFLLSQNRQVQMRVNQRTEELDAAYHRLNDAQEQLVQSEKMASLGSLVAGVAHELNTPIGNALMASTLLNEKSGSIKNSYEAKGLTKALFEEYVGSAVESASIIEKSLAKASKLIRSFKEIAVDRTSDRKRNFYLLEIVDEVLQTLNPVLKKTPFKVDVQISDTLQLNSYPGPFGQVLSNFINNSLLHGFEGKEDGIITISAEKTDDNTIAFHYKDDGKGVPQEIINKIFDPFFTTKLGKGGSGLGLNIVYNMINKILGGEIKMESEVGRGLVYQITLPVEAPDVAEDES